MEEDERLAMERTFEMNRELGEMRDGLETLQLEAEQERSLFDQEREDFVAEKKEHYESLHVSRLEDKVSRMAVGDYLSPIATNMTPRGTPRGGRMGSLLGSIIKIPEADADVTQEADELLKALDRLIAETQTAMTDGMTPSKSSHSGIDEESSVLSVVADTDVDTTTRVGSDSQRVHSLPLSPTNVVPLLVETNGATVGSDMSSQLTSDETLDKAVERLQTALRYRDSHQRNDTQAIREMKPTMVCMAKAHLEKLPKHIHSSSSTDNREDNGAASSSTERGERLKRLERALIALWQLYEDAKDGSSPTSSSSSRIATTHHLLHEFHPTVGSPLRFGGNVDRDSNDNISISDLHIAPTTPTTKSVLGDRRDSMNSNISSNPSTPVNWERVQSLVAQTGEQLALQQSRFEEQLEIANKNAEERVQSK
jgi:hypothetical protein